MRIFALVADFDYDWKGEDIHLSAGDTLFGGKVCQFPGARDYQTVRDSKRIWFSKETVESTPKMFRELFA